MNLFNIDSPLVRFLEKLANIMILNWLMLIFCIPIVTIGPAITAVYWVTLKMVRNEEGGIIHDFIHSFRVNLKQGMVVGLIVIGIGALLGLEIYWMYQTSRMGGAFDQVILGLVIFLAVLFLMMVNYVWALLAKFNNSTRQLFRTARALAIRHLIASVVMAFIAAVPVLMLMYSPASMTIAAVFYLWLGIPGIAFLQSTLLVRIFDQYLPSDDENSEADVPSEV